MRLNFWAVECVLWILQTHYTYEKCLLESKETFGITQRVTRRVEMILKQVKAIFVDFSKMTLRKAKIIFEKFAIFSTSKKLIFMCLYKKKQTRYEKTVTCQRGCLVMNFNPKKKLFPYLTYFFLQNRKGEDEQKRLFKPVEHFSPHTLKKAFKYDFFDLLINRPIRPILMEKCQRKLCIECLDPNP